jgi:ribosome-binding factor A
MQATRRARLQAVIQEELSVVVPREVKDPRVPPLTITQVEVTSDGSQATVFVSVLGSLNPPADEAEEQSRREEMRGAIAGLTSASGYLRRHLARVLTVRHIPNLIFKEDKGLANATRVYELLRQVEATPTEDKKSDEGSSQ